MPDSSILSSYNEKTEAETLLKNDAAVKVTFTGICPDPSLHAVVLCVQHGVTVYTMPCRLAENYTIYE